MSAATWLCKVQKHIATRGVLSKVPSSYFAKTRNNQLISLEVLLQLKKASILGTFDIVVEKCAYTAETNYSSFSTMISLDPLGYPKGDETMKRVAMFQHR